MSTVSETASHDLSTGIQAKASRENPSQVLRVGTHTECRSAHISKIDFVLYAVGPV